jgi:hypothetical protein
MEIQHNQLNLIQEWNEAKEQLKHWSLKESDLRDKVINSVFDAAKIEGTETIDLAGDWKLRAVKKFNYSLSNKDGQLANILASFPSIIAQNLVRWNPDLNLSIYRKLNEQNQQMLSPVLIIKPARPSLELVPPNAHSIH